MFIDLEARYINVSKSGRDVWLGKLQLTPQCARMNFKNVLDWFYGQVAVLKTFPTLYPGCHGKNCSDRKTIQTEVEI